MGWPFEVAFAIGALMIAFCMARYFVTVFLWPGYAAAQEDERSDRYRTRLGNLLHNGYLIAACVGIGFCIYQGAATALRWIPQYWMDFLADESEREGIESLLSFLAAFWGAAGLVTGLSRLSSRIVIEQREVDRLRAALEDARTER